ncbi:MAG: hypothetical protein II767_10795 [Proteobacteria bacterium]|nr:hypothetical protein [Pseudomonadota bacterium]
MQIISVAYDEKYLKCGRIQNTAKPEFVKLKQFAADKKGLRALDGWIDECCQNDRSEVQVSLVVEDQQGASLAYHFFKNGIAVVPMTYWHVANAVGRDRTHSQPAELIARQAVDSKRRWKPMSPAALELRNAIFAWEGARLVGLQNYEKNLAYQAESFDFLFKLTQNAVNIQAEKQAAAAVEVLKLIDRTSDFREDLALLRTIPGMNDMAAAALILTYRAFEPKSGSQMAAMLRLAKGGKFSRSDYRSPELRLARCLVFDLAANLDVDTVWCADLVKRFEAAEKPENILAMAAAHKLVRMAYAMLHARRAYSA